MKKIGIIAVIAIVVAGIVLASVFFIGRAFNVFSGFNQVSGSGNVLTEQRNAGEFTKVSVSGAFTVEITAQKQPSVEVEADDNLLPLIKTEISGGVLRIWSDEGLRSNKLKIRVGTQNVERLEISGASKISLSDLNNELLKMNISGASNIEAKGKTVRLEMDISGASEINTENLTAETVTVDASGASEINVFASASLDVEASGATRVHYSGDPANLQSNASGASSIKKK